MSLRAIHTEERLLTRAELAELIGVSEQTVRKMQADGLPTIRWGSRLLRYRPSAVYAWLEEQA